MKKAEIEKYFWDDVKRELEKKLNLESLYAVDCIEYLEEKNVDILSFKLENLSSAERTIYLGIARNKKDKEIFFFVADDECNKKDVQYNHLLGKIENSIKSSGEGKEWRNNQTNLYLILQSFSKLFDMASEDYYNFQKKEFCDDLVKSFIDEYERIKNISLDE